MEIYLVGGAVRDELLGLPVKDRDWVVTGATPEEMLRLGYRQVGADFPVFLHPTTHEEYALARTERKNGQGYHGFTVYSAPDVTLEDDLKRRDLTINAMAKAADGTMVDPFQGRQDLESRQLRHVSEAFSEDPLRILRTARFAARLQPMGFGVADRTMALMTQMAQAGEVGHLVPERVWQEVQRALHENEPGTFFTVLQNCSALESLIPELASDTGALEKAMTALHCAHQRSLGTDARFAALLSPLATLKAGAAEKRAKQLKAPNDCVAMARLVAITAPAMESAQAPEAEKILTLLDTADAWRRPERFATLLDTLGCVVQSDSCNHLKCLEDALEAANAVSAQLLMAEGFTGKALGEAIHSERLRRIQSSLQSI